MKAEFGSEDSLKGPMLGWQGECCGEYEALDSICIKPESAAEGRQVQGDKLDTFSCMELISQVSSLPCTTVK